MTFGHFFTCILFLLAPAPSERIHGKVAMTLYIVQLGNLVNSTFLCLEAYCYKKSQNKSVLSVSIKARYFSAVRKSNIWRGGEGFRDVKTEFWIQPPAGRRYCAICKCFENVPIWTPLTLATADRNKITRVFTKRSRIIISLSFTPLMVYRLWITSHCFFTVSTVSFYLFLSLKSLVRSFIQIRMLPATLLLLVTFVLACRLLLCSLVAFVPACRPLFFY